jgi:hypothetical protein
MYIVFVESKTTLTLSWTTNNFFFAADAFNGKYGKNPFEFVRKFPCYTETAAVHRTIIRERHVQRDNMPAEPTQSTSTSELGQSSSLMSRIRNMAKATRAARGKGKSKSKTPDDNSRRQSLTPSAPREEDMPEYDVFLEEEEVIVIPGRKTLDGYSTILDVNISCGGNRVDSLYEVNTEHDAMADFIRMNYFSGTLNCPFSNSISYNDFLTDCYILAYDFSTGQNSNLQFLTPATRFGHVRAEVTFSRPLPCDVSMLVFLEYPADIRIDADRKVGMTHLNTTAT